MWTTSPPARSELQDEGLRRRELDDDAIVGRHEGRAGGAIRMSSSPDRLIGQWRCEAETLRKLGATAQAVLLESCVGELEAAQREQALEALTLNEATQESGYSYSTLQKKVASGELPNVGSKNCPRVRRGDLPRKAGRLPRGPSDGEPDLVGTILTGG